MNNSQFTQIAPSSSIEELTNKLTKFLRELKGTDVIVQVNGGINDADLRQIEKALFETTGRKVALVCHEFEPLRRGGKPTWHVGIVDEQVNN